MKKITTRSSLYDPLNDFLFYKVMGERGDEIQLLGFINAVLGKTGDDKFTSVEILENKTFTPENIGDKSVTFDVRAVLHGKTKVNVEVQLRNEHNMDKRSLFYWSEEFIKSLKAGQDYSELPDVIAINIIDFEYINTRSFHSCFRLRDDNEREVILTNSLEIHFINMVKYRKTRGKLNDPLNCWLTWFDRSSTPELLEEVVKMDSAIQTADERLLYVTGDEDAQRAYLVRFRAMCDLTSMQNASHRKGREEGLVQGREEAREEILKLFEQGLSIEEIKERLTRP
ncbi:MAG: Rpn family recombination-promoting nuclease/putative transposase [Spirochaetes bacterium]|nr:Rpn family recombination-promoting nuclease/putative transposase [Spirochaetota bacterium]